MPFGYLGTTPNQQLKNSGVFSVSEALQVQKDGEWGGSLQLIEEQTFSGVTAVDFTSIGENNYDVHLLQTLNMEHTSTAQTRLQFYESGVLETGSEYEYAFVQGESNGNFYDTLRSTGESFIYVTYSNNGTNTGDLESSYIYLYDLGNSAKYSQVTMQSLFQDNGVFKFQFGGGTLSQASTVDGIRLDFQSASTNGTAKLYGVKQI